MNTISEVVRSFEHDDGVIDCPGDEVYLALKPFEDRLRALEAALRKGCEYLHDFQWYGVTVDESKYIRDFLAEAVRLIGALTPNREAKETSK